MPNIIVATVLLLILLPKAHATELRKCAFTDGRHLYANSDCPAGSREVWRRVIAAATDDDDLRLQREDTARWRQMNREEISAMLRTRPTRAASNRRNPGQLRCQQARQRRTQIRQRDFMRMDYERMLALDRQVANACR